MKIDLNFIKHVHLLFNAKPYDFLTTEAEAQFQILNLLRSSVGGELKNNIPYISSKNNISSRFRLEWKFNDQSKRHDIVAFKEKASNDKTLYELTYEDIDFFLEIKVGWGYSKTHFTNSGIQKDFKLLENFSNGYLFFFLGNTISDSPGYKEKLEEIKNKFNLDKNRVFVFFLGDFKESYLT